MSKENEQKIVCERAGETFNPPKPDQKIGIALNTLHLRPLNGLRHRETGDTCGWYIWGGPSLSAHADFFQPLHARHLEKRCPQVIRFLALPPGYRFLIADDYEDVWEDRSLLRTDDT